MHIDVGMMKPCKFTWSKPVIKVANLSSYRTTKSQDSTMVISMPLSFLPYKEVQ